MNTITTPDSPTFESLQLEIIQLKTKLAWYEEQFRLYQHKKFGSSSERFEDQGLLFNEAEELAEEATEEEQEPETQTIEAHQRKKPVRKTLSEDLPRDVVTLDVSEEEKQCDCCGKELQAFGHESSCKLDIVPAQVKVIEFQRLKYRCECESGVKTAPMPKLPIPKSIATPGLLAWIITSKYCDALPLYRQEFILKRMGVEIRRASMAEWMIRVSVLLQPLYDTLQKMLVKQPCIQADETPLQVLNEPDRTPQNKSYMWLYRTTGQLGSPVVLYNYQSGRDHGRPQAFLSGFSGYLQCDGLPAYKTLSSKQPEIKLVGCLAHARRKFKEALDAIPKKKGGPQTKISKPAQVLNMIQTLYAIERRIKDKSVEERFQIRQSESRPVMDKLKKWLDRQQPKIAPKNKLGKAITYAQNQWPYLMRYLDSGLLDIDNNAAERAIKPFVIGRKNWLFAQCVDGAKASAVLYSLIETAKANGLEPYAWFRYVLSKLPQLSKGSSVEHLLPMKLTQDDLKIADWWK
ncbi:IS66 family transposase [Endozoicomonas gorgoniicola]|uniref:IS66 family transposase n=1 Tax=Endozoicomonas gorgoniicola TaxID=1234144 RepID=A0ABT3MQM1_9GAMM|nr:IS66 family transposase [Endozoicomonas gorgoniicola]MCW7551678.1 IS66 family transposase [Endozoicomonas gorgoniicola]MCW7552679.1 IS66 family transposase [Endozoicomonas gorgoniicola]MCW7553750.1 IS66 family transposase [Endozoicomonas gorgoniicola]